MSSQERIARRLRASRPPSRAEVTRYIQVQFDRFQREQSERIALRGVVSVVVAAAVGAFVAFAVLRLGWLPR